MKYGYVRVSTSEHDHAGQIDALKAAGAVKVLSEKMSGVRADRPRLARAVAALDQGDVLVVTRIDRLVRSSRDLLNIVHDIEATGATFESLTEPWANTNPPTASAMLTMLSAFAQLDRAFILARTKEGRERAKAQGSRFGPSPSSTSSRSHMHKTCSGKGGAYAQLARCSAATPRPSPAHCSDQHRNMARFYKLNVQPTLFDEWAVVREWGRIGSAGTVRIKSYLTHHGAELALITIWFAKLRAGYQ